MQVFAVYSPNCAFPVQLSFASVWQQGYAVLCPEMSLLCDFVSPAGSIPGHLSCDLQLVKMAFLSMCWKELGSPSPNPPGSLHQSAHERRLWAAMLLVSGADFSSSEYGSESGTVSGFTYMTFSAVPEPSHCHQGLEELQRVPGAPSNARLCFSGVFQTKKISTLSL